LLSKTRHCASREDAKRDFQSVCSCSPAFNLNVEFRDELLQHPENPTKRPLKGAQQLTSATKLRFQGARLRARFSFFLEGYSSD
jgi:hypothetical protein